MKCQVCCRYGLGVNYRGRLAVLHKYFVGSDRYCWRNESQNAKLGDKHQHDSRKRKQQRPEVWQDDLRNRPFETSDDCCGHDRSGKCNPDERRRIQDVV